MNDETNGVPVIEAKPKRSNGHDSRKSKHNGPVPGISIRELYEERNWTALAGLGLLGVGLLYLFGDLINISVSLWALSLLGIGGFLMFDGWQKYQAAGERWVENSRNRVFGGGVIALVGLMGTLHLNWWGLLLLGVAGWLGYDTWQKTEDSGGEWTQVTRNRMLAAGAIGLIGLFGLVNLGSAWSWLLILAGGIMIYRHWQKPRAC